MGERGAGCETALWQPKKKEVVSPGLPCRQQGVNSSLTPSISQHLPNRRTDAAAVQTGLCTWRAGHRQDRAVLFALRPPPRSRTWGSRWGCAIGSSQPGQKIPQGFLLSPGMSLLRALAWWGEALSLGSGHTGRFWSAIISEHQGWL